MFGLVITYFRNVCSSYCFYITTFGVIAHYAVVFQNYFQLRVFAKGCGDADMSGVIDACAEII